MSQMSYAEWKIIDYYWLLRLFHINIDYIYNVQQSNNVHITMQSHNMEVKILKYKIHLSGNEC